MGQCISHDNALRDKAPYRKPVKISPTPWTQFEVQNDLHRGNSKYRPPAHYYPHSNPIVLGTSSYPHAFDQATAPARFQKVEATYNSSEVVSISEEDKSVRSLSSISHVDYDAMNKRAKEDSRYSQRIKRSRWEKSSYRDNDFTTHVNPKNMISLEGQTELQWLRVYQSPILQLPDEHETVSTTANLSSEGFQTGPPGLPQPAGGEPPASISESSSQPFNKPEAVAETSDTEIQSQLHFPPLEAEGSQLCVLLSPTTTSCSPETNLPQPPALSTTVQLLLDLQPSTAVNYTTATTNEQTSQVANPDIQELLFLGQTYLDLARLKGVSSKRKWRSTWDLVAQMIQAGDVTPFPDEERYLSGKQLLRMVKQNRRGDEMNIVLYMKQLAIKWHLYDVAMYYFEPYALTSQG